MNSPYASGPASMRFSSGTAIANRPSGVRIPPEPRTSSHRRPSNVRWPRSDWNSGRSVIRTPRGTITMVTSLSAMRSWMSALPPIVCWTNADDACIADGDTPCPRICTPAVVSSWEAATAGSGSCTLRVSGPPLIVAVEADGGTCCGGDDDPRPAAASTGVVTGAAADNPPARKALSVDGVTAARDGAAPAGVSAVGVRVLRIKGAPVEEGPIGRIVQSSTEEVSAHVEGPRRTPLHPSRVELHRAGTHVTVDSTDRAARQAAATNGSAIVGVRPFHDRTQTWRGGAGGHMGAHPVEVVPACVNDRAKLKEGARAPGRRAAAARRRLRGTRSSGTSPTPSA